MRFYGRLSLYPESVSLMQLPSVLRTRKKGSWRLDGDGLG